MHEAALLTFETQLQTNQSEKNKKKTNWRDRLKKSFQDAEPAVTCDLLLLLRSPCTQEEMRM
jgi:hypothetical protein